jgi:hypothetical protein
MDMKISRALSSIYMFWKKTPEEEIPYRGKVVDFMPILRFALAQT